MLKDAEQFKKIMTGLIRRVVKEDFSNVLRVERYDVTTAPADGKMGVTQPFGGTELMLPYSEQVATAQVGDAVLVLWRGSLSTAKVWCFGDGPA